LEPEKRVDDSRRSAEAQRMTANEIGARAIEAAIFLEGTGRAAA
jgi:hypothetical protein